MTRLPLAVLLASASTLFADLVFGPDVRIDMHVDGTTGEIDIVGRDDGRFCVVWVGENSNPEPFRVWSSYSDDFGETWSYQTAISDSDALGTQLPEIVADSLGYFYTVWQDWRGPEPYAPYFSRSLDGGETWLWPNVKITDDGEVGLSPGVATSADGSRLVAVFDRLNENRIYSSYSSDGGLTWSADVPVGDITPAGQYYPVVEYVDDYSFVAIWNDERDTESPVYCSISEDGGQTWLSPNIPIPCGGHFGLLGHSLDLHWDGSVLHAFWIEQYWTDTAEINEVYYSRSSDGGVTWLAEPVRVDGGSANTQIRRGGLWARAPSEIYSVWCSIWNQSFPIYVVCSVSTDSGRTWSDTVRANPESGEAILCDIYGDVDSGDVLVTWANQLNQFIECAHGYDETGIPEEPSPICLSICGNPFSSDLSITYGLREPSYVELTIYDLAGRLVRNLVSDPFPEGNHLSIWSPDADIPDGCYIVVLDACGERITRRCIRL